MRVRLHGTAEHEAASRGIDTVIPSMAATGEATEAESETLIGSNHQESETTTVNEEIQEESNQQNMSLGILNNLIATDISNLENGQYWIMTGRHRW